VLRINFGIYRRVRRRSENKCGKLTIAGTWGDDETHKAIRAKIRELNPGWDVQGYCLSDPQSDQREGPPTKTSTEANPSPPTGDERSGRRNAGAVATGSAAPRAESPKRNNG
jgi:hypothetical protein